MPKQSDSQRWTVVKNGVSYAGGPLSTLPDVRQRRSMAAAGYITMVDGKRYRSGSRDTEGK